jgi:ketosteroid isomerase-like protein
MKKFVFLICALSAFWPSEQLAAKGATNDPETDKKAIQTVIEDYKKSINEADTLLAKKFWLTTEEVSFIHPRGHQKGWNSIRTGIYEMFGSRFSKRDLKSYNESITLYGDMAVVEFYWVFDAIFSGANSGPMQSKGRETQVLKRFGSDWKIVHIHYSSMPATGERQGF